MNNKITTNVILITAVLIFAATVCLANNSGTIPESSLVPIDGKIDNGKPLEISCYKQYAPFSMIGTNGMAEGILIDIWKLWEKKTGIQVSFILKTKWSSTLDILKNETADIHSGLSITDERSLWMDFSSPFYEMESGFFYTTSSSLYTNSKREFIGGRLFDGKKIGVISGTFQENHVKKMYPLAIIVRFDRQEEMIGASVSGEIDVFMDEIPYTYIWLSRNGMYEKFFVMAEGRITDSLYAGVLKKNRLLLKEINNGFSKIPIDELAKIEARWIPDPDLRCYNKKQMITNQDKEWLSKHPVIRVGIDPSWAPFDFLGDDGKTHKGFSSDYIKIISEKTGVKFKVSLDLSWSEMLEKVKIKEIDVVSCLARTKERETYLNFTQPYATMPLVLITREDSKPISTIVELEDNYLSMVKGFAVCEWIKRDFPAQKIFYANNITEGLNAVLDGRAEAYIDSLSAVVLAIREQGLSNLKVAASTPYTSNLSIGVRKDWPDLVWVFDKILASVSAYEHSKIQSKWNSPKIEEKINWKKHLKIAAIIAAILGAVFVLIIFWNRRLSREVILRQEAEKKAHMANLAKSRFLARMSHEIRTPMNAIVGMGHLLSHTELNEKQRDYISKIDSASHTLLDIINDILDFSKIEVGKISLESIDFNLDEIFSIISDVLGFKAEEKGLKLLFSIANDVPNELVGDPLRLKQVLINLIANAIKFTHIGDIFVSVETIGFDKKSVELKFFVKDTGIGFEENKIKTLFTSFSQADNSITREYGGSGLGLAICKRLVNMMDGDITATSEPSKGSIFSFTAKFGKGEKEIKKRHITPVSLIGLQVLIVDDNKSSQNIMKKILTSFSFGVVTVSSGREAIDAVLETVNNPEKKPFDLIIMDWQMPGMNGIETSKTILGNISLPKLPKIIMLTAFDREDVINDSKEAGFDAFLVKPITPSLLLQTILTVFNIEDGKRMSSVIRAGSSRSDTQRIRGARVLVVEDNEINQQVAEEILENAGIEANVVGNGIEALKALEKEKYDAVLMDLEMPGMDGYETTRNIRMKTNLKLLPVIAMTAHAMDSDRDKCIDCGMNDFVGKPIDPNLLFAALVRWIPSKFQFSDANSLHEGDENNLDFPSIEGIDVQAGILRLGGNTTLYKTLLQKFVKNYADSPARIKEFINKKEMFDAKKLAHSLKGVGGNIGAKEVFIKAGNMETAIRQGQVDNYSSILSELSEKMDRVIEAINDYEKDNCAGEQVLSDNEPEEKIDMEIVQQIFRKVYELLKEDSINANKYIDDLGKQIRGVQECRSPLESLKKNVEGYDFEKAIGDLESLAKTMGVEL